ncbi:hypothetical protein Clacol_006120 [Clathrus columnatus]|uniref:Checkpoint protein RAD24-like helical bundle domain-containing protein n=1 Tax=Clathrus columnatus TaxID=1419009 RepID=A0AAV5AB67_9AGAM|nr:hypothetical protein Clacol_006120 [Clathrus columnatus]
MPPNTRRKTATKVKSKLSTLTLDNLPSRPKQSASVISLLKNAPIPLTQNTELKSLSQLSPPSSQTTVKGKGKGKEKEVVIEERDDKEDLTDDDDLIQSELAIHKKKVDEVRQWLKEAREGGPNETLKKYRRVLALTGLSGTGKTATLKVLAKELEFEIVEWRNTLDDHFIGDREDYDYESLISKFHAFLTRSSSCKTLSLFEDQSSSTQHYSKQVILLEDLPNILHPDTALAFHTALEDFVVSNNGIPLICIISDTGLRGEDPDGDFSTRYRGRWDKQVIDVRSVIPPAVFNSPFFREIRFNPIAPTIMTKALTALLSKRFDGLSRSEKLQKPNKEVIQLLVEASNGDIRSAIMALQFACVVQLPKESGGNAKMILGAVSRREQSLALFHLLGKILYNKRKGDPASNSSTIKAREILEESDSQLKDPPPLPEHLSHQYRRTSRVDVNTLYADSPIDSSLFALYLHQNYTQYCDDMDQCEAIAEQMSWTDSTFPEFGQSVYTPYQFQLIALNTLHHLPSPVPRHSQKLYKPAFFDALRKTREAEAAVADTVEWLNDYNQRFESGRNWSNEEIILDLGALLRTWEMRGVGIPPPAHAKFSSLTFVHPARMEQTKMEQLNEDEHSEHPLTQNDSSIYFPHSKASEVSSNSKGWLETDDITEF